MPKDLLPDDAVLLININEHPQIATQIGIFVGCYAGLEITLWELYNQILGHVDGSAIELLGGIQSFAHRMSAVERFVIHTKHTKEADILDIFQAARLANDFRNQLLHGLYAEHSDKTIWLHSSRTDPTRREGKSFLLDPREIERKSRLTFDVSKRISVNYLGADPDIDSDVPISLIRR